MIRGQRIDGFQTGSKRCESTAQSNEAARIMGAKLATKEVENEGMQESEGKQKE